MPVQRDDERSVSSREPERDSNPGRRSAEPREATVFLRFESRHARSRRSRASRPSQTLQVCSVPPCPLPSVARIATLPTPPGLLGPAKPAPRRTDVRSGVGPESRTTRDDRRETRPRERLRQSSGDAARRASLATGSNPERPAFGPQAPTSAHVRAQPCGRPSPRGPQRPRRRAETA
jgi:hypothetical protein